MLYRVCIVFIACCVSAVWRKRKNYGMGLYSALSDDIGKN